MAGGSTAGRGQHHEPRASPRLAALAIGASRGPFSRAARSPWPGSSESANVEELTASHGHFCRSRSSPGRVGSWRRPCARRRGRRTALGGTPRPPIARACESRPHWRRPRHRRGKRGRSASLATCRRALPLLRCAENKLHRWAERTPAGSVAVLRLAGDHLRAGASRNGARPAARFVPIMSCPPRPSAEAHTRPVGVGRRAFFSFRLCCGRRPRAMRHGNRRPQPEVGDGRPFAPVRKSQRENGGSRDETDRGANDRKEALHGDPLSSPSYGKSRAARTDGQPPLDTVADAASTALRGLPPSPLRLAESR